MHFEIKINDSHMDKTFKDVNTIAKMIFDFLVREKDLQNENLALCTGDGSVLTSFPAQGEGDKTFTTSASDSEFTIIADSACTRTEEIEDLQNSFSKFFSIFYSNERLRNFIFDGLDALPNSICIYDENLRLLYANSDFCSYLHIKDRDVDLGRPINDILKDRGVQFTSVKKPHDYLKVNDVIRYGKPVIDWEV